MCSMLQLTSRNPCWLERTGSKDIGASHRGWMVDTFGSYLTNWSALIFSVRRRIRRMRSSIPQHKGDPARDWNARADRVIEL